MTLFTVFSDYQSSRGMLNSLLMGNFMVNTQCQGESGGRLRTAAAGKQTAGQRKENSSFWGHKQIISHDTTPSKAREKSPASDFLILW